MDQLAVLLHADAQQLAIYMVSHNYQYQAGKLAAL